MSYVKNSSGLPHLSHFVSEIFELEKKIIQKDSQITLLAFELDLQKQLYVSLLEASLELSKVGVA